MALFTAVVSAVAATAAQDVFEIVAPSNSNVLIRDIKLNQYTDFGDAAAEILSVLVIRGHTVTGSGGSACTPTNLRSLGSAAGSTVAINNTTVATTSGVTLVSDAWNLASGWALRDAISIPDSNEGRLISEQGIWLKPSERLVVRITAPADSITINATMLFEELGIVG